ncbi:MAG: hypothetical protein CMJ88_01965 [Planctomycetes bacterium]|nr:hypothetical protein [Planctomycetota bacterium]
MDSSVSSLTCDDFSDAFSVAIENEELAPSASSSDSKGPSFSQSEEQNQYTSAKPRIQLAPSPPIGEQLYQSRHTTCSAKKS